jgi:penicillin-binding protein 1B
VQALLYEFGLERPISQHPSMLLGAAELTPLELTQLYQGLATGGRPMRLKAVREVLASDGKVLARARPEPTLKHRPEATYMVNLALQEAIQSGTGQAMVSDLRVNLRPAGKTGTSNDQRDAWFAGFTGSHVGVVWLGLDNNQPMGLTGASGALKVWEAALRRMPGRALALNPPANVDLVNIDAADGRLTEEHCARAILLPFVHGYGPREFSSCGAPAVEEQDLIGGFIAAHEAEADQSTDQAAGETATEAKAEPQQKPRRRFRWWWQRN